MKVSDLIYEANQATVEQLTSGLDQNIAKDDSQKENSWLDKILNNIKEGISDIGENAKQILNSFIDAIALFIIAYCVLPIIIVLCVVWLINILFKLKIPTPNPNKIRLKFNKDDEEKE